jgi:5,6-dimethylbenzimidazole synthase
MTIAQDATPLRLDDLLKLLQLRRDVRHFRTEPLPEGAVKLLVEAACLAPSVGFSQPWRFVSVESSLKRRELISHYESANDEAAGIYEDDSIAASYKNLKLSGLQEAPEHMAIFAVQDPPRGRGLGRQTMPESVVYSVVAAIQNLWLAARCEGIGIGWVSILRPSQVNQILEVPESWQLIAYLCLGYPTETEATTPLLERLHWERRASTDELWKVI